jgi:hypothetical protein
VPLAALGLGGLGGLGGGAADRVALTAELRAALGDSVGGASGPSPVEARLGSARWSARCPSSRSPGAPASASTIRSARPGSGPDAWVFAIYAEGDDYLGCVEVVETSLPTRRERERLEQLCAAFNRL